MLKNFKGLVKYDPSQNNSNMINSIDHLFRDNNIEIGFYRKSNMITAYITDDRNDVIWECTGNKIELYHVLDLGNVKGRITKHKKDILLKVANFLNIYHIYFNTICVHSTNTPNAIGIFCTDIPSALYYYKALSIGPSTTFDKTDELFKEHFISDYNKIDIHKRCNLIFINKKRDFIIRNIKTGVVIGLLTVVAVVILQLLLGLVLSLL